MTTPAPRSRHPRPRWRPRALSLPSLLAALMLTVVACETSHDEGAVPVTERPSRASPEDAIRQTALGYVRQETAVPEATIRIASIGDGWARVDVFAVDDRTDPAVMYLREEDGEWRTVTIGTAFAPDELDRLGVPASVRPPE